MKVRVSVPRTKRFYQFAACGVALATASSARAVLVTSTGDPTFNTTPPTGALANSGWQYQINYGFMSATPVGPNHILTALHTGATVGNPFTYNGVDYTTTEITADYGDLRLMKVDKTILSYAPLYDSSVLADRAENGKLVVVTGRGFERGGVVSVGGEEKGWYWNEQNPTFTRRWGTNNVAGLVTINGHSALYATFDRGVSDTEAGLAGYDSGGGVFIADANGQWKLAGINFTVTGPYSFDGNEANQFHASLYDTGGLYNHQSGTAEEITDTPADIPSGWYASRVGNLAASIRPLLNLPPTWKANANGNWGTAGNWANGGPPGGVGAIADFRTAINGARTVTYSGTIAVGTLNFDSAHSYSIVPSGAAQLNLDVASGNAAINVASGNHSVAGVLLQDPTVVNIVQPSSTLTLGIAATPQPITKQGQGTLTLNRLTSGAVTVSGGTVALNANGGPTGTSKVASLSIAAGAKLDLANNDMVVANTPVGGKVGDNYVGLTGLIVQASAFDTWTGLGITSSAAAAAPGVTTLGIGSGEAILGLSAGQTAMWSGQTVGASDALIAYTYAGDANLDGQIDAADYGVLDYFIQVPGASGYANGDFNYDGFIDAADYGVIDNNIQVQGPPLVTGSSDSGAAAMLGSVAAVPEPAALSLVAFASALLARRRRRRG